MKIPTNMVDRIFAGLITPATEEDDAVVAIRFQDQLQLSKCKDFVTEHCAHLGRVDCDDGVLRLELTQEGVPLLHAWQSDDSVITHFIESHGTIEEASGCLKLPTCKCTESLIQRHSIRTYGVDEHNKYHLFFTPAAVLDHYATQHCCSIMVQLVEPGAQLPRKALPLDVGYDLTVLKKHQQLTPRTALYDTGLKIAVPSGYYTEIVPRSSLSKTGYMLANSVGIIENTYRGNLFVALTKIDDAMPDICDALPSRLCQLVIRQQLFAHFVPAVSLPGGTQRGDAGFGSTNNLK